MDAGRENGRFLVKARAGVKTYGFDVAGGSGTEGGCVHARIRIGRRSCVISLKANEYGEKNNKITTDTVVFAG